MATKASFHWDDPLLLDQQLTGEERQVRDAAHAYSQDKLATRVLDAFRNGTTDAAIFREMGELGLLGPTIPEAYGGAGLNYVCYGLVAREVERVDSGYRSMMSVQSSLVMLPIFEFGTEAQKQKYLPRISHVQLADNPGRNEPGSGEINYAFLFSHLDRIGYGGWIGCEYKPATTTQAGLGWLATANHLKATA